MKRFLLLLVFATSPTFAREPDATKGVVFCTYNLKNYVGHEAVAARDPRSKPKSEKEIAALIEIIRDIQPDILGVCEMGSPAMFDDFKTRLEKAGLGFTDSEYLQGDDPDRHLALVSRFPIVRRESAAKVRYTLNGVEHSVKRGFLDVTLQITPSYQLRCVGVHLKSKLPAPEGEALIRRNEAMKLRHHLDAILQIAPATNLLCYGDLNDAKNSPTFSEVSGVRGTPTHMDALAARDSVNDRWTHHWAVADEYSRIDYLFASQGLSPEVRRYSATIYRSEDWEKASDHRPVFVIIDPFAKRR